MKMIKLFLFVLIVILVVVNCGTVGNQPNSVAMAFFKLIRDGGYEDAKKYATADSFEFIEAIKHYAIMMSEEQKARNKEWNIQISITDCQIDDKGDKDLANDVAICNYTTMDGEEDSVTLVRGEENAWKVMFKKEE